ncbi:MAG: thioredoxin family protein [Bacteroidia bacterium]|nr:thioredoxin family protein [Bacteroidia bacterium]
MQHPKTLITLFLICLIHSFSMAQGIEFEHGTWKEALKKAKKEHKYIMVDAYTEWCGPCKWMSAEVFPDPQAGEFFNPQFVSLKMDMEKGEGLKYAKLWDVNAYPTLLFFDSKGKLVHRSAGMRPAEGLIGLGRDALNPETQLMTLAERFEKGDRDPEFLFKYTNACIRAFIDYEEPFIAYRNSRTPQQLATPENWAMLTMIEFDFTSPTFQMIRDNEDLFREAAQGNYDKHCMRMAIHWARKIGYNQDSVRYDSLLPRLAELHFNETEIAEVGAMLKLCYYANDSLLEPLYLAEYLDNHCRDWEMLNENAWNYAQKYPDQPAKRAQAMKWVNKSIDLESNFYNLDTKAYILKLEGSYEEALKYARLALGASEEGDEVAETEKMISELLELARK